MTDLSSNGPNHIEADEVEGELLNDGDARGAPRRGQQLEMFAEYRGPLPLANEFNAYGERVADAPERILVMAEKAQQFAHEMQRRQTDIDEKLATGAIDATRRVDYLAAGTFLAGIVGGLIAVFLDAPWAGLGMAGSGAAAGTVVKVFFGREGRQ